HPPELDVADDVVDRKQADAAVRAVGGLGDVAGEVHARVVRPGHKGVDDVAVRGDRRTFHAPGLVLGPVRLGDPPRAALNGLAVGLARGGHGQCDVLDAVAVQAGEVVDRGVAAQ